MCFRQLAKGLLAAVALSLFAGVLSGCWNRRELNELAITVAMGIDKAGEGYLVSAQVIDPTQVGRNQLVERTTTTVYQAEGKSILEALRRMTKKCPRKIYVAHLRILVIGESVAREGIARPLDFFFRDDESRSNFNIIVAKGDKANEILSTLSLIELIPATELYKTLETSQENWAPTVAVKVVDLIRTLGTDGIDPVLTGISIVGNESMAQSAENGKKINPSGYLEYKSIAVFKKDKLIGWLNEDEGKSYNYVTNHVVNTVGQSVCPEGGGLFAVEIFRAHTTLKPYIRNGSPAMRIEAELEANLGELECRLDVEDNAAVEKLEAKMREDATKLLKKSIQHVQKTYATDIYGFGKSFHIHYPREWKKWRKDWPRMFKELPVEVSVDVQMRRMGKTNMDKSEIGE